MTKRLKVYLLIIFAAAACIACTLAGCKIGRPGRSELLAGYDTHVTYYSNGGYFDNSTALTVREVYFKGGDDGVPFFNITQTSRGMKVEREACDLIGWYLPETYSASDEKYAHRAGEIIYEYTYTPSEADPAKPADKFDAKNPDNITVNVFPVLNRYGNPVTDDERDRPVFARESEPGKLLDEKILEQNVTIVCSDVKVNEGDTIEQNIEDPHGLIVCAKWLPAAKICYQLVVTDIDGNEITGDEEYTTADGKETFKNGDVLAGYPIAGESEIPQSGEIKKLDGLTFVRTFLDRELSESLKPIARPQDPSEGDPVVYCRYIVGDWTVVRNAADVGNMFSQIGSITAHKFYIINDIEYAGSALNTRLKTARAANATIKCDKPHTISGLKFNAPTPQQGLTYSIFGTIGDQFEVSGLTLKDISITVPISRTSFSLYAICADASKAVASKIDLTIENITATYSGTPTINNALGDDRSNWIFGCEGYTSDDAFLAAFTGIKLKGTNKLEQSQQ